MDNVLTGSSISDQIENEMSSLQNGVERYDDLVTEAIERGEGGNLKASERLIAYWYPNMVKAIAADQRAIKSGQSRGGKPHIYGAALCQLKAKEAAVLALNTAFCQCLQQQPNGPTQGALSYAIGRAFEAQINLKNSLAGGKEVKDKLNHAKRKGPSTVDINRIAKKEGFEEGWGMRVRRHVGDRMLYHLQNECLFIDKNRDEKSKNLKDWIGNTKRGFAVKYIKEVKGKGLKTWKHIQLSEFALVAFDDGNASRARLRPIYQPMITVPAKWSDKDKGGYYKLEAPLILKSCKSQKDAIAKADMSAVYDGVNHLNATPWQINPKILSVITALWERGGSQLGMPSADPLVMPPRIGADDPSLIKEAKKERARIWKKNVMELSLRKNFLGLLNTAQSNADRTIFFPHTMDFRGRAYPVPVYLQHQGDDISRGLLQFEEGVKLDDRATWWLKVHIANCFGVDSGPFSERVLWVDQHESEIDYTARYPLEDVWWHQADKPFQFLAAAMALSDGQVCHIPIQQDGSCNGLQHYAALGRDEVSAAAVNMIPNEFPSDIYEAISEQVGLRVSQDASAGDESAKRLVGHINRKMVKSPTMTKTYGVTPVGTRRQLQERIVANGIENPYETSKYLREIVNSELTGKSQAATKIMDWLSAWAVKITKQDKHQAIKWTSPIGLPVVQHYRNLRAAYIRTCLGIQKVYFPADESQPVAKSKQHKAFSPNFIHALDASHMLLTANACQRDGIAFAAVHDSYWCPANRVDDMRTIIKTEFISLHNKPILENLQTELRKLVKKIPDLPIPERGNCDLNQIMKCEYFFQ